jgi:hypothetical protein
VADVHVILTNWIAHGGAEWHFKNVGKCIRKSFDKLILPIKRRDYDGWPGQLKLQIRLFDALRASLPEMQLQPDSLSPVLTNSSLCSCPC